MLKKIIIAIALLSVFSCISFHELSVDEQLKRIDFAANNAFLEGDMEEALSQLQKGVAIARSNQKYSLHGLFLLQLANIEELNGHYSNSKDYAAEALEIAIKTGNKIMEARSHIALGNAFSRVSKNQQALAELRQAQPIMQQLGDSGLESDRLLIEGRIEQSRGALIKALSFYETALKLARKISDPARMSKNLNNIGGIYRLMGEYVTALQYYEKSLAIRKNQNYFHGQGKVLGNICLVYINILAYEKALDYCEQSLDISQKVGDSAREANQLNNIGAINSHLGKYNQAIKKFQRSLEIKLELSDKMGAASSLNNIGEIYWQKNEYADALSFFSRALALAEEIDDRPKQSATHHNLSLLYMELKQYDQAMRHFGYAHNLQIEIGQPELIWRILDGISLLYEKQNNWQSAILFGKLAVNTIQEMRFKLDGLNKTLQKSFLQDKEKVYRRVVGQLIDQGRLIEGQQIINMLKEEEYFDFIRRDISKVNNSISRIACTPSEEELCEQYNAIRVDLIALGKRHEVLKKKGEQRTRSEKDEIKELEKDMKVARKWFKNFISEVKTELIKQPLIYGDQVEKNLFAEPYNLQRMLKELKPQAVVLHYVVRENKLSIILTTSTQRLVQEVNISAKKLRQKIAAFRDIIINQRPVEQAAKELYSWVVEPVAHDLKASGAHILMLSLDDALRYLPLSALHDGEKYLAENYAISFYNAAANNLDIKDKPQQIWKVAAFGLSEPVTVDTGEGKTLEFKALPNVPAELDVIVKENDHDSRGILQGKIKLNRLFTEQALNNLLGEAKHQVIHIASHFNLNPGNNKDSFLVLGEGKTLSLARILEEGINFQGVDLLVLSACNTAVAGNNRGKEVENFGTLAQSRGAKSIMASLWSVSDESTSEFMQTFYSIREKKQISKTEALQKTQLLFIQKQKKANNLSCRAHKMECVGKKSSISHPYHWSAFVLMGNWL